MYAISNMVFCGFFCGSDQPPHFYRSTDGGATWTQLTAPVPDAPGRGRLHQPFHHL